MYSARLNGTKTSRKAFVHTANEALSCVSKCFEHSMYSWLCFLLLLAYCWCLYMQMTPKTLINKFTWVRCCDKTSDSKITKYWVYCQLKISNQKAPFWNYFRNQFSTITVKAKLKQYLNIVAQHYKIICIRIHFKMCYVFTKDNLKAQARFWKWSRTREMGFLNKKISI